MHTMRFFNRPTGQTLAMVTLLAALLPAAGSAQPEDIDPQAEQRLKESMTFLGKQRQFHVSTQSTIEVVLTSGQKLQFGNSVALLVQRPNKFRAERVGDLVDQIFYYDGDSLTLYNPGEKYFATVDAPDTLEATLDYARTELDIVAPAGDLVYRDAFDILMQDVTTGFVVGKGVVEGVRCDHLAFRNPDADWQIWIQEGIEPLPRKLVITSRDVVNAPQFEVIMTDWDLAPKVENAMFEFVPPNDAQKIEFLNLVKDQ